MSLPTTRSALVSAATTTIAVPCWSSWKTGMSSSSRSRRLDLEAARRGDVLQVDAAVDRARSAARSRMISSVSWVSRQTGQASTPANRLNSAALPSITGSAAARPDVAQAEHGRAVGDHGDGVALDGQPAGVRRVLGDRHADPGDARGVGRDRSSRLRSGTLARPT